MNDASTVKYEQEIPDIMSSLASVHEVIDAHELDRTIHHLVQLRASQINGCAFCIKMHTKEARQDGETSERLDQVIVWDQVDDFSKPEQAALAWTEALTVLAPKTDLGTLRARLRQYFSEPEIGALTATIAMINLWNRIGISRH